MDVSMYREKGGERGEGLREGNGGWGSGLFIKGYLWGKKKH